MARLDLKTIKKINKEKTTLHGKVCATYSCFDYDGEKIVQIDTYGRDDRVIQGKISQSIQLDEESARFFVKLLIDEFKMLD